MLEAVELPNNFYRRVRTPRWQTRRLPKPSYVYSRVGRQPHSRTGGRSRLAPPTATLLFCSRFVITYSVCREPQGVLVVNDLRRRRDRGPGSYGRTDDRYGRCINRSENARLEPSLRAADGDNEGSGGAYHLDVSIQGRSQFGCVTP